jgi:hypothetical protein
MTKTVARGLRVTELAAIVGLAPDTIRYYERAGLLPPPERSVGPSTRSGSHAPGLPQPGPCMKSPIGV